MVSACVSDFYLFVCRETWRGMSSLYKERESSGFSCAVRAVQGLSILNPPWRVATGSPQFCSFAPPFSFYKFYIYIYKFYMFGVQFL